MGLVCSISFVDGGSGAHEVISATLLQYDMKPVEVALGTPVTTSGADSQNEDAEIRIGKKNKKKNKKSEKAQAAAEAAQAAADSEEERRRNEEQKRREEERRIRDEKRA